MTTFIVACLLIMPWIFNPSGNANAQFRLPQDIFLLFMFMGIVAFGINNGIQRIYRNKYFSLFLGYIFLNFFLLFLLPIALFRPVPTYSILPMFHVLLGSFAIYIMICNLETEDFIRIAKALCVSSIAISIFSLLQYFKYDPLSSIFPGVWQQNVTYKCDNTLSACLDNPNLVGGYLALTSPLFMYFGKKYWLGYALSALVVFLSHSYFAYVCFIFAGFIHTFVRFRKIAVVRLSLLVGSGITIIGLYLTGILGHLLKTEGYFLSGRMDCWIKCFEIIKKNPLFGLGLGFFNSIGLVIKNNMGRTVWMEVHNDYLQYIIELGLLGVGLFLLMITNSIKRYSYSTEIGNSFFTMFLTFLVFMLGSFPLEVASLGVLGLLSFVATEKL